LKVILNSNCRSWCIFPGRDIS